MKTPLVLFSGIILGVIATAVVSKLAIAPTAAPKTIAPPLSGPIKYNCELSGGTYTNGACVCPLESIQTQEDMYDTTTGFCQTTFGGPGGAAFAASIGLPHGSYSFYNEIIMNLCTKSGGNISGAACICPTNKNYSEKTGQCE